MVTVSGQKSKEILGRIIRSEFDKPCEIWEEDNKTALIEVAENYGLFDLAKEMKKDL